MIKLRVKEPFNHFLRRVTACVLTYGLVQLKRRISYQDNFHVHDFVRTIFVIRSPYFCYFNVVTWHSLPRPDISPWTSSSKVSDISSRSLHRQNTHLGPGTGRSIPSIPKTLRRTEYCLAATDQVCFSSNTIMYKTARQVNHWHATRFFKLTIQSAPCC